MVFMGDLDAEFMHMARAEKYRSPSTFESIKRERQLVVDAFYDHLVELHSSGDLLTFDDFMQSTGPNPSGGSQELSHEEATILNRCIQIDIEKYKLPLSGEMKVTGEGVYAVENNQHTLVGLLHKDEAIHGTILYYFTAPLVSIDEAKEEVVQLAPALWVELKDAVLFGPDGNIITSAERMSAPFTQKSLDFEKVLRTGDVPLTMDERLFVIDIRNQLAGRDFLELAHTIETDLNRDAFESNEARTQAHVNYQRMLDENMRDIDINNELLLSVNDATIRHGGNRDIVSEKAYYNCPAIVPFLGEWRVVQTFTLIVDDDPFGKILYALPGSIKEALMKRKE